MSEPTDNPAAPGGEPRGGLQRLLASNDIIFALGVAMVLCTLLIPLPTFLLDTLLALSIGLALATLIIVLSARESLELSAFPSLLLVMTLFRLSLNVASTRLILMQGDAGDIIETFGSFVVGGGGLGYSRLIIGLVVFLILVIIQFVVITKGAERISEVAARFNLDAMPGKQMAIDADLNAGLLDEQQARERREKIVRESEFYGSMDGASKFIRGDAVAGLIITGINLVGGFIMGLTRGLSSGESIETYSLLSVGDGLVSQIPAVIISTSAGFLISKASTRDSVSHDLLRQMTLRSRPLGIASFLLGAMIFVPGFPKAPFVVLSLGTALLARALSRQTRRQEQAEQARTETAPTETPVEELLDVDKVTVQVGPRLISLVDPRRKSSLSNRISPLRRKFAEEYGIILPLVRLRDNVSLEPNTYEIRLFNHPVGSGRLEPDKLLAMDPGTVENEISGAPAREPVFNLPALWIDTETRPEAELNGYTVVDPESILVTHLSEALKRHAHELLSRDDVRQLVDRLADRQPTLVKEVVGDLVSIGLLRQVLQNLLADGIPVRDLAQILECLGDQAHKTKDPVLLTELARKVLRRAITEQHTDPAGRIVAVTLEPAVEYELCSGLTSEGGQERLSLPPEKAVELVRQAAEAWKRAMEQGYDKVVLLCDYRLRRHLAEALGRQLPQLPVLAYDEIVDGTAMESVAAIRFEVGELEAAGATA